MRVENVFYHGKLKMKQSTIKDVAKLSGFSITTVSRVLSGSSYPVSAGARDAIQNGARDLGYFPNILARSLKTSSSNEVAVIVPSIVNPFFTDMVSGIEEKLAACGYNMLIYLGGTHGRKDAELLASLNGKMIAGVVISADCITPGLISGLLVLKAMGTPVIVTDYATEDIQGLCGIFFDYAKSGRMAAGYLVGKGHRSVAVCSRTLDRDTRRRFISGIREMLSQSGVSLDESDVFQCDIENDFEAGVYMAQCVLEANKGYTAIAANNDAVAVGALSTLIQSGVRVPEDISLIGLDDCVFSRMSTPLLTTVRVPACEMGRLASRSLLEEIEGKHLEYSIYMEPSIVERQTVKHIGAQSE